MFLHNFLKCAKNMSCSFMTEVMREEMSHEWLTELLVGVDVLSSAKMDLKIFFGLKLDYETLLFVSTLPMLLIMISFP